MAPIPPHPVGGLDYPRTLQEFDEWLASEDACLAYVQRLRWPAGFCCPACSGSKFWVTGRGHYRCGSCQRQTSPIAGTIVEGTRKPLRVWFQALWYVTNQKLGGSALGLQRVLGLGRYQTAWTWRHKLRRAMVRPGRDRLSGTVEVDETYVGAPEVGVHGRETERKAIVAVAAEEDGQGIGRVRLRQVPDISARSVLGFIEEAVTPGAVVHTDGWSGYTNLAAKGSMHKVTTIKRRGEPAHELMPRVHRIASLLKRWLLGTHHGAVSDQHLAYYLDEFTFRFNRRRSRARGLLFYRLLQQATEVDPVPYKGLIGGDKSAGHKM